MKNSDVVCGCNNVTVGDIKDSLKNGVSTFEQLQEETNIGIYCPPCKDKSKEIFLTIKDTENL